MKWFNKYRKGYAYLIAWTSEEKSSGKQLQGSSSLIVDHKVGIEDIDGIANHISSEISEHLTPVVVTGITCLGRAKKS